MWLGERKWWRAQCNCGWKCSFLVDDLEDAEDLIPIHVETLQDWERYYGKKWPNPSVVRMVEYEDQNGTTEQKLKIVRRSKSAVLRSGEETSELEEMAH